MDIKVNPSLLLVLVKIILLALLISPLSLFLVALLDLLALVRVVALFVESLQPLWVVVGVHVRVLVKSLVRVKEFGFLLHLLVLLLLLFI